MKKGTKRMYKVIKENEIKNYKSYQWFKTFPNPCYGFNVKMDVTKLVNHSKTSHTSFFANMLYLVTKGLNSVEEMRIRYVRGEIRLYDVINPTFTVMTVSGAYENSGFKMVDDYKTFYKTCRNLVDTISQETKVKEGYNDSTNYDDYYITCVPWIYLESMTHPLPHDDESSSVPRICWDKYRQEGDKIVLTLNITVSHRFVDGKPLCQAFNNIQALLDQADSLLA